MNLEWNHLLVCTGSNSHDFVDDMNKVAKESEGPVEVLVGQDLRAVEVESQRKSSRLDDRKLGW